MVKIFGISNLPIAHPFPSIQSDVNFYEYTAKHINNARNIDVFVRNSSEKHYLKKLFRRMTHK